MTSESVANFIGRVAGWLAYQSFRSPLARRSQWIHTQTMKLFRVAADRGDAPSLATYGFLLYFRGADQASKEQGALYIKAAAEAGDSRSQYQMGRFFEQGGSALLTKDDANAYGYYKKAADQGHPLAIQKMIDIYHNGELGQTPQTDKALDWSSKLTIENDGH